MTSDPVVHVIDDDDAARDSLAFLLGTAGFCVRSYRSAIAFLDELGRASAGCIVSDMRMPGLSGLELLRCLRNGNNSWPLIVITGQGDVSMAVEAIRAGAADFIEKPFDHDVLLTAVRSALGAGGSLQNDEIAEVQTRMMVLSAAEQQVLAGLVAGHLNAEIARRLEMNPRRVEIHRANILTKMQATSLSHLVRMTLRAAPSLARQGQLSSPSDFRRNAL